MGWYSHIKNKIMRKRASAADIANNAINLLNNGLNPNVTATIFTNQMKAQNPNFDASQVNKTDANSLRNYLAGIINTPAPAPAAAPAPAPAVPQSFEDMPIDTPTQPFEDMPIDTPIEEDPVKEDTGDIDFNNIPEFGDMENDTIEEVDEIVDMEEEPDTLVQREIQEDGIAQDIQEVVDEVPGLERRDEFEDMTLNIRPEDMGGVEDAKHITQREFSIPTTYKTKNDNLKKLTNRIAKINKYKDSKGQSPVIIRFKTQDGQPSSDPVIYQKERTNAHTGESHFAEYVDFILEGEPPNPLGNPVKEIKNPDGTVSFEEVVYQIIGSIQIVPIEGYKPKEEKFSTEEEAANYIQKMNMEDPTRPYYVGKKNKSQKFGELYPETKGMFYPATYNGKWRTIVDHYPNTPAWSQEYVEGSPLNCDHCGTKKRGMTSRRSVYVAIEYPAGQLITQSGKPRDPLPEEMFGKDREGNDLPVKPKQVWIGTGCVEGQKTALQFLEDLEKFREVAMGAENTGRASDAFGGSMRSPKGIEMIMANYFAAGRHRPRRSGSWFPKRYGEGLSNYDFKEFQKYYFGRYRSDMRKAAIEKFEWEEDIEKYPDQLAKHERNMAIYPYLINEWRQEGANPDTKPAKPIPPKKPSDTPPPGPKPLPWGEATEDDVQKAKDILNWWKEKRNDPTINYNDLEVNEQLGASGEKMHNMISVALSGQVDSSFFHYIPDLVGGYQRDKRATQRVIEDRQRAEQKLVSDEENAYVDNESFNARRIREQQQETERAAKEQQQETERATRAEQLETQGITLSDMSQVPTNGEFTAEFKNIGTKESQSGRYSDFKGPDGLTYRIFDKYKAQRREPKYDFQSGESYLLNGIKGEYSDRWRNAPLNKVKVIDPNAPTPPVGGDVTAVPGTIPENAIVPNAIPEMAPETPMTEPEAPIERAPVGDTLLEDEERGKNLQRVKMISDSAKSIIETGKTRDIIDEWGNTIPGKEISPEELIPLYLEQVSKAWRGFNKRDFEDRLINAYRENGREGLRNQIKLIPIMMRNLV